MSISVEKLMFSYKDHEVLKDVSFNLPPGKLSCILGPNGCGKSTLFRCILHLEESYTGSISIDGEDLRTLGIKERARRIAFVPQSHLTPYDYSVLDVVLMATSPQLTVYSSPKKDEVDAAWAALSRLGIASLAHRSIRQISGGERQLVLIARALMQGAKTILMDEPTSALDYGNTLRVLRRIKELTAEGYSIIQTTHQPEQAFMFADYLIALSGGSVIAQGTPQNVLTQELMARLYRIDVKLVSLFADRVRICVPEEYAQ